MDLLEKMARCRAQEVYLGTIEAARLRRLADEQRR